MKKKYTEDEYPPYIIDEISGEEVMLVGYYVSRGRIFLRLFDGNDVYKREVIYKK